MNVQQNLTEAIDGMPMMPFRLELMVAQMLPALGPTPLKLPQAKGI